MKQTIILCTVLLVLANSLACEQGSVANPQNICINPRYIEGCSQYLTEASCKVCNYRYALRASGLCELDTHTSEDCCALRGSDNSCTKCQTGLYLISGKCQQSNIIGCLEKDSHGICLNCASGFYLTEGTCKQAIKNCNSYTDNTKTICKDCSHGFSLINNLCAQNSVLGCKNEVNYVCKECIKPYSLNNGNCYISNCKTYNEYRCAACECGYYLTIDGICKPMELGCVRYQRGQCTDCLPNYKLKGSTCDMEGCTELDGLNCKKCEEKYDLFEGGCRMKHCQSWKDGQCQICSLGFNYQSGSCVASKAIITE